MKTTSSGTCLAALLLLAIPTSAQSPKKPVDLVKKTPIKTTPTKKTKKATVKKVVATKPKVKSSPTLPATSTKPPASLAGQKVFGVSY